MEIVNGYRQVLKDEVPIYREPMQHLFDHYTVYVFGYGSLLGPDGWLGRGMLHSPKEDSFVECVLNGFERGPFGVFGIQNYYGLIRSARKRCNGVLVHVKDLHDWVNLMYTEHIAGLTRHVNYRVLDITDNITGIDSSTQLKEPYKIHCVCNRPINRQKMLDSQPAIGYYEYVMRLVESHRSQEFAAEFLKTGGFRNGREVTQFINKEAN